MASKDTITHAREQQSSSQPPLQPTYVLRGHAAQIQTVQFLRDNSRLLTGDGDGWMVLWGVAQRRAVAVWPAHHASILGSNVWGANRIITHGRDSSLRVWLLRDNDEPRLSNVLPIDGASSNQLKPWLQHSLAVNTLNFCSFAMCRETIVSDQHSPDRQAIDEDPVLIAVPGVNDKEVNVFQLPTERCLCIVPVIPKTDTGMLYPYVTCWSCSNYVFL
ncbi:hypothetical protein EJ05DRAFT_478406 [Pseudovirgaria hyperparasitica]|uniref:ASTRA-associated protein 1 n=1 Tax=Pseudovirgaria hyperparasitica TaxID=470096 RepID=A0A6A6VZS7_9PEZI|nr:uncharacterized protein EJ05DRAFT_478406 [Pseudovirgaria hyperparasitica]KAF2755389.1 hypothetical protein EJ05DRAFT_478406 [Pseudovirgaria hyperparasitica]